ncbi:MAG: addiction module antidote protein [Elusimicrobiota bacterium]
MRASKSYAGSLQAALRDPEEAAAYLNAALAEEDLSTFLLAVRDVSRAQGGLSGIAKKSGLNRENLYRMLSIQGNPRLRGLRGLLSVLGLTLAITKK